METALEKFLKRTFAKSSVLSNAGLNVAFAAFIGLTAFMIFGQETKVVWTLIGVATCIVLVIAGTILALSAQSVSQIVRYSAKKARTTGGSEIRNCR